MRPLRDKNKTFIERRAFSPPGRDAACRDSTLQNYFYNS
jgi:hypothetical protein